MPQKNKTLQEVAAQILSEAAIDTLQQDAVTGQEPMHHLKSIGDPLERMTDLGGSTLTDPAGGNVGQKAAAVLTQMKAPKGPVIGPEGMHAEPVNPDGTKKGEEDAEPPMATQSGNSPTPEGTEEVKAHSYWDLKKESVSPAALEAARQSRIESIREAMKGISVEEDIQAIFGNTQLTEEFRNRIKNVFETAVITRAMAVVEQIEEEVVNAAEESVTEIREELENKLDTYLDHVVKEWLEENKVAVESGLRSELTEEFMTDLRTLFLNHNISIPEEKVDVVESLTSKVEELQNKLNETLNSNIELNRKINESQKGTLINTVSEGLTATQKEKFKTLAESVDFTTEGEFVKKLNEVKTSYFSTVNGGTRIVTPVMIAEQAGPTPLEEDTSTVVTDPTMQAYTRTISRFAKFNK